MTMDAQGGKKGASKQAGGGWCRCCSLRTSALVALLLGVVLWLLPSPIDPIDIDISPCPAFEGPLQPNNVLSEGRRLFVGRLLGPESFAADSKGNVYTGLRDGRVVKIVGDEVVTVTRFREGETESCRDPSKAHLCGRPLSLGFHPSGQLYVVDTYSGLYSVDTTTGEQKMVWNISSEVRGTRECKLLNSFDVLGNGSILMSHSSSHYAIHEFIMDLLDGRPSGKLFVFHPEQDETRVLVDGISFANGVLLSKDESFVLVAESGRFRILRYYLKGPKSGTHDIFVSNLPGIPDNICHSSRGNIWVPLASVRRGPVVDFLTRNAWARLLIAKLRINLLRVLSWLPAYGMVLEVDWEGNIVRSFHDPAGSVVREATEVVERPGGKIWIGSFQAPYIAEADLPQ